MSFPSNLVKSLITYWSPSGNNKYGQRTFNSPVEVKAHWEDRALVFIDQSGAEARSQAIVYLDTDVVNFGWLFNGISTDGDPTSVSDAKEIRGIQKRPVIDGGRFERRAFL